MGEDMPKIFSFELVGRGAFCERKLPEVVPDIFLFPLAEEGLPFRIEVDSVMEIPIFERRSGLANGQETDGAARISSAVAGEWAMQAVGLTGGAEKCTKLHDGGVVQARLLAIEYVPSVLAKQLFAGRCVERLIAIHESG